MSQLFRGTDVSADYLKYRFSITPEILQFLKQFYENKNGGKVCDMHIVDVGSGPGTNVKIVHL
jgi:hypothetical protein